MLPRGTADEQSLPALSDCRSFGGDRARFGRSAYHPDVMPVLDILMRYLHVVAACLAVGGAFFIRFVLPQGTRDLDAEKKHYVLLRSRRAFKMVVHSAILALLVSGAYNAVRLWLQYKVNHALLHPLFGAHLLLALTVFTISIVLLKGVEPPRKHRGWMKVNVVLMLLAILAASTLKWARERENRPKSVGVARNDSVTSAR
jgi:uncharacterized membrane protein